ncbi:glycine zipper 2TM domain-containing protein [Arenimonas terrae]|uniref:Glycine zipper 2TM domain-containing protein n=1 Tax=Arenimonas terrae TaxID=2546226 RepID=A0A5C4RTY6_9GAMM|nr:glycine zipper 2TM domain-containing protein [Arenimonas terrae]TNJ34793.1 glycine zipper 2TM domain-containing protein [Arenimonas terrae]
MKRLSLSLLTLAIATAATLPAAAQQYGQPRYDDPRDDNRYDDRHNGRYDDRNRDGNRYADYAPRSDMAQVMRVESLQGRGSSYQRQECWNEQSNRYDDQYFRDDSGRLYEDNSRRNVGGAVVGAVVGGALGNQVGDGNGRTAATVAGAVIGGMLGSKVGTADGHDRYRDDAGTVRRCRTTQDRNRYSGQGGYNVTYRYAGQTYHAVTQTRPGRNVRVLVDVRLQDNTVAWQR